jgi:hypothetical protein
MGAKNKMEEYLNSIFTNQCKENTKTAYLAEHQIIGRMRAEDIHQER